MFSAEKVLHEIMFLLSINDGRMNLLKLMKELYLADRESIKERDTSISGDDFCSMPHGPVLSRTLNVCYDLPNNAWAEYLDKISTVYHPDIAIRKMIDVDLLSNKDKEYLTSVSERFKNYSPYQLELYTHKLQEWVDPHGSSRKIRYADVMRALGKTEQEILEAKKEYEQLETLYTLGNA